MEEQGRIQVRFQSQRDSRLEKMGEVLPGFNTEKGNFVCNRCGNQNMEDFAVGPCIICNKKVSLLFKMLEYGES